jgi:hypothetical protein
MLLIGKITFVDKLNGAVRLLLRAAVVDDHCQ